jgi:hypothetical protein
MLCGLHASDSRCTDYPSVLGLTLGFLILFYLMMDRERERRLPKSLARMSGVHHTMGSVQHYN